MMTSKEFMNNFESIEKLLLGFAFSLARNSEKAKDLVQETFAKAYKNKDKFREGTNFKAWMTTIMRNAYINQYRKLKTRNRVEVPLEKVRYFAESKASDNEPYGSILYKELHKIIGALPKDQKKPFMLHFKGFQYKEISEQLNVPIGTIKSRIFFARKKLQKQIIAQYGERLVKAA